MGEKGGLRPIAYGIISLGTGASIPSVQSWPAITAGAITEFIAATILFVYQSVFRQTENYFRTLERLTTIGMAIRILDGIADDPANLELKNTTRASFAELLLRLQHTNPILDSPSKDQGASQ